MPNVHFSFRRGAGDVPEILYGKVEIKPTLAFARGTSLVLPAPTTLDLVNGEATANNVYPTPDPVAGQVEWAYRVKAIDTRGQSFEWMVGVPDSTGTVEFASLPRYFETRPPLFGKGEKGDPGEAAKITVGTVTGGATASVTNSGTNQNAILDFVLPQGPAGPKGDGVTILDTTFDALPESYTNGTTIGEATEASGWPFAGTVQTDRRSATIATQTLTSYDGSRIMQRSSNNGAWTVFKEVAWNSLASPSANGLMSSSDKAKLNDLGVLAHQSRSATDSPSTFPEGTTVGVFLVANGWPAIPGGSPSLTVVATTRPRQYMSTTQWAYSYKTAATVAKSSPVLYRQGIEGSDWGPWNTVLTREQLGVITPDQFGAVGDGIADDTQSIKDALAFVDTLGIKKLSFSSKKYKITSTLGSYRLANTTLDFGDSVIDISTVGAAAMDILRVGGNIEEAKYNLTDNAVKATTTVAADTSGLVAGDMVFIGSSQVWDSQRTGSRVGEVNTVKSITSASSMEVVTPLAFTYGTAYNAFVRKINPVKGLNLVGGTFYSSNRANTLRGVAIEYCIAPRVSRVRFDGINRVQLQIMNSTSSVIESCDFRNAFHASQAYGISSYDANQDMLITNCSFDSVRHSFTTNNDIGAVAGGIGHGVTKRVTVQNCAINNSSTATAGSGGDALDTHAGAEDISFIGNVINGSSGQGINFEARSGVVLNNLITNSKNSGIYINPRTDYEGGISVSGNTVDGVVGGNSYGIAITSFYSPLTNVVISDNNVRGITGTGIRIASDNSLKYVSVVGNTVNTTALYGIHLVLGESYTVTGNSVYASGVGIYVAGDNGVVSNNSVELFRSTGSSVWGIRVNSGSYVTVNSNTLRCLSSGATTRIGVSFGSGNTVTNSAVIGNVARGFATSTSTLGDGNIAVNNI